MLIMFLLVAMLQTYDMQGQTRTDSLQKLILRGEHGQEKMSVLYALLTREYYLKNNDSCLSTGYKGLKLAEISGSREGIIKNCMYVGLYLLRNDSLASAKKYLLKANHLLTTSSDHLDKMRTLNGLGYVSELQSDFAGALNYYLHGKEEAEKTGHVEWKADFINNISVLYSSAGMYVKCIDLYREAMKIYLELKDSTLYANTLVNLGEVFCGLRMPDSALKYYNRSLPIQKRLNNHYGLANIYLGLAYLKMEEHRYVEALDFLNNTRVMIAALDTSFHGSSLFITVEMEQKMAVTYQKMKQYVKADSLFRKALQHGQQGSFLQVETDAIKGLSEISELRGHTSQALYYAKLHHKYADSLWKFRNGQKIALTEFEFNYKNEFKQHKTEEEISESLRKRNKLIYIMIVSVVVGIAVVLLLLYLLQRSKSRQLSLVEKNLQLEKLNLQLEKKNLVRNIDEKNKEVMSQSMSLVEKNEKMAEISNRLQSLVKNTENENDKPFQTLIHDVQSHYSDRIFEDFNAHFLRIHPDFCKKLSIDFPELSPNDIKLSTFFRLNLTNKETAQIIHKTEHSIKIARHRLRKKLSLSKEEHLTTFLSKY